MVFILLRTWVYVYLRSEAELFSRWALIRHMNCFVEVYDLVGSFVNLTSTYMYVPRDTMYIGHKLLASPCRVEYAVAGTHVRDVSKRLQTWMWLIHLNSILYDGRTTVINYFLYCCIVTYCKQLNVQTFSSLTPRLPSSIRREMWSGRRKPVVVDLSYNFRILY